jgi:uncharacterized coiled-coil protein SlyX
MGKYDDITSEQMLVALLNRSRFDRKVEELHLQLTAEKDATIAELKEKLTSVPIQPVTSEHLPHLYELLKERANKIGVLEQQVESLTNSLRESEYELSHVKTKYTELNRVYVECTQQKVWYRERLDALTEKLKALL